MEVSWRPILENYALGESAWKFWCFDFNEGGLHSLDNPIAVEAKIATLVRWIEAIEVPFYFPSWYETP